MSVSQSHPEKYSMHTTRSWEFSGLEEGRKGFFRTGGDSSLLSKAGYGKDVIVGMLDSGKY